MSRQLTERGALRRWTRAQQVPIRLPRAATLLPVLLGLVLPAAPAVATADTAGLRARLESLAADHDGVVGISVRNLETGESISIRGDETFPSASLIKVAVLVTLLDEVAAGRVELAERSTLIARDRVGGTGILRHMAPGLAPTLEDLAWLMITISDNTATNLILDKLDIHTVWEKMEALGLGHTKIHSKTFRRGTSIAMDSSVVYGLGVTTPDETVRLFELLHRGQAVSPELDSMALGILAATQDADRLRRWLPPGTRVAHKTGSVAQARNDCGIVYGPMAPVAVCVMTRENADTTYRIDHPANALAAGVALEVFRHFGGEAPAR
jgi:beta-lactamase class A